MIINRSLVIDQGTALGTEFEAYKFDDPIWHPQIDNVARLPS